MTADISLALIQNIVDSQKDLIVVFHRGEPIVINKAFMEFVSTSSLKQYKKEFGPFVNNFVPHPSYFHSEKIEAGDDWFDAILKLPEIDRVVSMITPNYEPHAFSVDINSSVEEYIIVTFTNITQTLIKRIMIENHANMDEQSGAYAKKYFLQIAQSYQDAANFNEKLIGAIFIKAIKNDGSNIAKDKETLNQLVAYIKKITRQDDMLIRWGENTFVLLYLADNAANAKMMLEKLETIAKNSTLNTINCTLSLTVQKEGEEIKPFMRRVEV